MPPAPVPLRSLVLPTALVLYAVLADSADTMLGALDRLAQGDLTIHLDATSDDEALARLHDGYNQSTRTIRTLVADIRRIAADAARATERITSSAEALAEGARAQSEQTDEVAAAAKMTETIVENARNATRTADAAPDGGRVAEAGSRVVAETKTKMQDIAHVVGTSAETVERLGASSEEIGSLVQVIEEIADHTNLLALNAAIESETAKAVEAMNWGRNEVEHGLRLAEEAGAVLTEIVRSSRRTVDLVPQIAAASEEQSATSEQIAGHVAKIRDVAHESARGLGEIVRSVEHVNTLTEDLDRLAARFTVARAAAASPDPLDAFNLGAAPSPGDGHASRSAPELGDV